EGYMAIMAGNLSAAKAAGQLADWAEPAVGARHLFALYMPPLLACGRGGLALPVSRAAALSGCCHLLAGVARGQFAADVEARIRELPKLVIRSQEPPHAASHSRD